MGGGACHSGEKQNDGFNEGAAISRMADHHDVRRVPQCAASAKDRMPTDRLSL